MEPMKENLSKIVIEKTEKIARSKIETVSFWENPENGKIELDYINSKVEPRFKPKE